MANTDVEYCQITREAGTPRSGFLNRGNFQTQIIWALTDASVAQDAVKGFFSFHIFNLFLNFSLPLNTVNHQ